MATVPNHHAGGPATLPQSDAADACPPTLPMSTKRRIWDAPAATGQPAHAKATADAIPATLRERTLARDGSRCRFCGFQFDGNEVHHANDNHNDLNEENLWTADTLCHGWQHLGELGGDDAVIAYLPGLSGQDVNHLQRTIMVALQSEDAALRRDATDLLNWMGSHRDYARAAWGSYSPVVFAQALAAQSSQTRDLREIALASLGLVYHPALFTGHARAWAAGPYAAHPHGSWPAVYHGVMNAPI